MNRNFLKQAQQIQARLAEAQEHLGSETVEASACGGAVTVVPNGTPAIESALLDPTARDPAGL